MSGFRQQIDTALAQWPALALAWSIHGVLILYLFFAYVPADQVPATQRLVVGLGLLFLVTAEIGVLILLNVALELVTGRLRPKELVDAPKAVAVAAAVVLLAASILKFTATSVHLKKTDLWFAWSNFRRVLEESTVADAAGLVLLPAGGVLLAAGLFAGLRRFRHRTPGPPAVRTLAPLVLAGLGFTVLYSTSAGLRLFADSFAPEIYWARSAVVNSSLLLSEPGPGAAGAGRGEPIRAYRPGPPARPMNVVLVMLESVPWSRTSLGGGAQGVTPVLDLLARESIVFERAYSTSTHSDYAQMAALSSLYPRKYDRHDYYGRIDYPRTLIWDALRPAGYRTSMFSCQNERWGNMLNFLNTPGLEVLRHSLDWPRARHRGRGPESKVYEETPVDEWLLWRQAHPEEPFFTYFNFQSNHFPYELPPEQPRPFAPYEIDFQASFLRYPQDKVPVMLNRFHNALGYADRELGRIVESLRQRGEWERTILIVVSDHGEAFYEHDMPTHGTSLLEEQVRSVWLMRVPGEPARAVREPVSLLDLAPALLRFLGLPPHGNFQGRADVIEPSYQGRERPLFFTLQGLTFEDGLLYDDWKYIVNWDRRQRSLYDLREDPGETVNLFETRGERALELDRQLSSFLTRQLDYYREHGWSQGLYPPKAP